MFRINVWKYYLLCDNEFMYIFPNVYIVYQNYFPETIFVCSVSLLCCVYYVLLFLCRTPVYIMYYRLFIKALVCCYYFVLLKVIHTKWSHLHWWWIHSCLVSTLILFCITWKYTCLLYLWLLFYNCFMFLSQIFCLPT